MKKALLFVSLFTLGSTFAQDCSKIFISEYVEGWSNNKALEIYNPTSSPVDLSQYFVSRYDNGSQDATLLNSVQLTGTVPPYGVYVGALDKRNPAGTGQEAPLWDSLRVRANGFYSPDYNSNKTFYWNGNDAVVLFKGILPTNQPLSYNITNITPSPVPMDGIGRIGENPGTGWMAGGVAVTLDHSLIRKPSIKKGYTALTGPFIPLAEWDSIPAVTVLLNSNGDTIKSNAGNPIKFGNWFSLGSHNCDCNLLAAKELNMIEMNLFPNPSENGVFVIKANNVINTVTAYNSIGQMVNTIEVNSDTTGIDVGNTPGVYLIRIETPSGIATKRVIVK